MKNVLVVDDTKNIRVLLTKCLELEGYYVVTANDGYQALELFESRDFDLAFLDIKMPQISGTEVLKRIREAGIKTPVIIITAYATIKNAVECTQMGAVAYLQKPFTAEKVRSVLSDVNNSLDAFYQTNDLKDIINDTEDSLKKGLYNECIFLLKKAISLEPANANIYLLFSKAYKGVGDAESAEKFYRMYDAIKNTQ